MAAGGHGHGDERDLPGAARRWRCWAAARPQWLGALAWALMALAMQPTLRFYARSPAWGLLLPLIAAIYIVFTFDSAYQHGRGRGGAWKGRVHPGRSTHATPGQHR